MVFKRWVQSAKQRLLEEQKEVEEKLAKLLRDKLTSAQVSILCAEWQVFPCAYYLAYGLILT